MTTQDYYAMVVRAFMGPGADPADPQTALDPAILYTYANLIEAEKDLIKSFDVTNTKKAIARLKASVDQQEASQRAITDIVESMAKSSRVSAENVTRLKTNAANNVTTLKKAQTDYNEQDVAAIRRTSQQKAAMNQTDPGRQMLIEGMNYNYTSTDPFDPMAKTSLGSTSVVLDEVVGTTLKDPNVVQKVADKMGDSPDAGAVVDYIAQRKLEYDAMGGHIDSLQDIADSTAGYEKAIQDTQAGTPQGMKAIKDAEARMKESIENNGFAITALGNTAQEAMEDKKAAYQDFLTVQAQYAPAIKAISDKIIGGDPSGSLRGDVVSSPVFQQWAVDQGYDNLGRIENGVYIEGADDTNALALWRYQQMHPDKYGPGLAGRRGATTDLVKFEEDLSPEALARFHKAGNKFLARRKEDGSLTYMTKEDQLVKLADQGGRIIESDGKTYVVKMGMSPDTETKIAKVMNAVKSGEVPEGKKAQAKQLIDKLVIEDSRNIEKRLRDLTADGQLTADEAAQFSMFEVGADGVVDSIRYTDDKLDILAPVTLKGERSPVKVGPYMKGDALIKKVAPTVAFVSEPPKKETIGRRRRLHFNDIRGGKAQVTLELPDGSEAKIDPASGKFTEVQDENLLGRKVGWHRADTAFAKAQANEMGEAFVREKSPEKGPSGAAEQRKEEREERKEERRVMAFRDPEAPTPRQQKKIDAAIEEMPKLQKRGEYRLQPFEPDLVGNAKREQRREARLERGQQAQADVFGEGVKPSGIMMRDVGAYKESYGLPSLSLPADGQTFEQDLRTEPVAPKYNLTNMPSLVVEDDRKKAEVTGGGAQIERGFGSADTWDGSGMKSAMFGGSPMAAPKSFEVGKPGQSAAYKAMLDLYKRKGMSRAHETEETKK